MNFTVGHLLKKHIQHVSVMDKKWFGDKGISQNELQSLVENNLQNNLVLTQSKTVVGFSIFEILDNKMPKGYVGHAPHQGKIMFIQQFTTATNYEKNNIDTDKALLLALEERAKESGCSEVWEALAINHPYKKENNSNFDAFGFYESQGYKTDENRYLSWQPNANTSIPCFLFRKKISQYESHKL